MVSNSNINPKNIVIIGASHAGLSCAEKLRQLDFKGQIVIVEKLDGFPFQKPPLSKSYLITNEEKEKFYLRKPKWFDDYSIGLKSGKEVLNIDKNTKTLFLSDKSNLKYDKLVIATGAYPKKLDFFKNSIENVLELRTHIDAEKIKSSIKKIENIVIIGGGYIGLEIASSLKHQNKNVTIIETENRILSRVASQKFSQFLAIYSFYIFLYLY